MSRERLTLIQPLFDRRFEPILVIRIISAAWLTAREPTMPSCTISGRLKPRTTQCIVNVFDENVRVAPTRNSQSDLFDDIYGPCH